MELLDLFPSLFTVVGLKALGFLQAWKISGNATRVIPKTKGH